MNKVEVLVISVAVFLTIISAIVMDLYQIQRKARAKINVNPPVLQDYQLNMNIIDELKLKKEL